MKILNKFVFPIVQTKYEFLENKWRHRLIKLIYYLIILISTIIIFAFFLGEVTQTYQKAYYYNCKYPLLNKLQIERLIEISKSGFNNSTDTLKRQQAVYQQVISVIRERQSVNMDDFYNKSINGDKNPNIMNKIKILRDAIEKKTGITYQENDIEIFNKIIDTAPELEQPFLDYLNNGDLKIFNIFALSIPNNELLNTEIQPKITCNIFNYGRIFYYLEISVYTLLCVYIFNLLLQIIYYKGIIYTIYGNKKIV